MSGETPEMVPFPAEAGGSLGGAMVIGGTWEDDPAAVAASAARAARGAERGE